MFYRGTESSINAADCVVERTIGGWCVTFVHDEVHGENHQSVTRYREAAVAVDPQKFQECLLLGV